MIAEKNTNMSEASQTLYELNVDEITLQKCRARDEYYRRQRTYERDMALLKEKYEYAQEEILELKRKLSEYESAEKVSLEE